MILHIGEVWVTLAVCFALGTLCGSVFQRAIALTALGKPQARLIRFIDRGIRWIERLVLPWRGAVPTVLPQTVPVPPPDFGHALDEPGAEVPIETVLPRFAVVEPVELVELPADPGSLPARVVPIATARHMEAIARGDAAGFRPLPLPAPRNGRADPLHLIVGVTRRHASRLGQVGVFHFSQIASWTPPELAWMAAYLGAGDAPTNKDWVGQAIHFASADEPILTEDPAPAPVDAAVAPSGKKLGNAKARGSRKVRGDEPLRRRKAGPRRKTGATSKPQDKSANNLEPEPAESSGKTDDDVIEP